MVFETFKNSGNFFQTSIDCKSEGWKYYTENFKSPSEALEAANKWLFWFENVETSKASSIYYILSIPDSWMGEALNKNNPYDGLQVKIGRTKNIYKRISDLKTGSEGQLVLHAIEPGDRNREAEIHRIFDSDRRQGEWFMCSTMLYKHILETWKRNLLLPPEYQKAVFFLQERIKMYWKIRKDGYEFDQVNPSLNDEWTGKSIFIDLVFSNIAKNLDEEE